MVKKLPANARDVSSIPGSGRFPGEGNDYPLQCSSWENSMDRGAWQAAVHRVAESDTTEETKHKYLAKILYKYSSFLSCII